MPFKSLMSQRMHLFDLKYSKNRNIVKKKMVIFLNPFLKMQFIQHYSSLLCQAILQKSF